MTRRITATVGLKASNDVVCMGCDHVLGDTGGPWKAGARVREVPLRGAGGVAYSGGAQVILRQFSCPGCGRLLDTETALPGDPYLEDSIDA